MTDSADDRQKSQWFTRQRFSRRGSRGVSTAREGGVTTSDNVTEVLYDRSVEHGVYWQVQSAM